MTLRTRLVAVAAAVPACCLPAAKAEWTLNDMVREGPEGKAVYRAKPVPEALRNPWPAEWERGFQERARHVIAGQASERSRGNTYFENEKRYYGYLMAHVLGGKPEAGLKGLQGEDHAAKSWHKHTAGIDYFACFTLKHQVRKYFYFGDLLREDYRKRMVRGAKAWTEKDPMRRPHHAYKKASGWTPEAKNSWVDIRTTENLSMMRWVAVYLFAEKTGNRDTAAKYKEHFRTYAKSLYRIGMGEWDSENYIGHTMTPLHNLYDFAKDPEVRAMAKACLDWLYTAAAVKYWRGGFNGPTKRDYNHVQPFCPAAAHCWVLFGDAPHPNTHWESDEVHVITSAYRPPPAVMNLARKRFDRPVEIFASKAAYSAPQTGKYGQPEYHETHYFGRTFQMGSLAEGTSTDGGDVSGWKLLAFDSERGVADIQCVPGPDPTHPGSPQYAKGKVAGPNRVGQMGNLAVWLVADGDAPWRWVLPAKVGVERVGGVTFLRCEKTWIALHPLNATIRGVDDELTEAIHFKTKGDKKTPRWPDHKVVAGKGSGGRFCGVAVEVGEGTPYEAFKKAVLANSKLDVSAIDKGAAKLTSCDGRGLRVQYADTLAGFKVWRHGREHDWADHGRTVYTDADRGADGLIHQEWLGGTLTVRAGGAVFTGTVDDAGGYTFTNR